MFLDPRTPIDPRGPRFGATLTSVVLAAALVTASPWLLALQALLFALGTALGVARSPYGLLFRTLVRPRIGPPAEFEDPRAPRFAQAVGLGCAVAGLLGYLAGAPAVGLVFTALALAAAFLNAAFGLCLGCELYLRVHRLTGRRPV